ncbi:histidine kinase [Streptomyces sp. NPDC006645]|uniref:sensor histidine kinase n=1 Tax=Streptomyces sp. NPDC006645 TaxID=3157184 RepID=UPI00339FC6CD
MTAATAVSAVLSVVSTWWVVPTVIAAFLAGRRPGRTGPTALVLVGVVAAGVVAVTSVPAWLTLGSRFVGVVAFGAMLPWFAGRFWRQWRDLTRAGWERAEQLAREQRLVAEQARSRERARIAQDMHDVLGHDLSLIALSAGALKLAPGLDERHRTAAGDIRTRAAAAVERLGEVIGVLREETEGAPEARGGEAGITRLADDAAASGLAVESRVDAEPAGLPPMVGRAAHRVVQEALTNVAKHAPDATATVRVRHTAGETTVVVENGPPSPALSPAPSSARTAVRGGEAGRETGRGLIGLDERVRLAGGVFTYGPSGEGFTVEARIPHAPPRRPSPATPVTPAELPRERRDAHRRATRTLVAAVMLPLVTAALLSGALALWETLSASRSVLEPGDYARLRVGLDRPAVEPLLPDRETDQRPPGARRQERGTTCEYYAMTADRFDDRSGDVYQLCFRQDTLVSLKALVP